MSSKKRPLTLVLALVGLAGLAAVAWVANRGSGTPTSPATASAARSAAPAGAPARPGPPGGMAMAVEMAPVVTVRVDDEVSAVGTLKSVDSVVLRPEVSGRVAAIRFRDGQRAVRGAVLIELDASTQTAELQQAHANLGLARTNYQRSEDLFQKKFVSQRSLDEAAAQLKVQEAALALAEARLAKMRLRAPFDGVVGLRSVSVGDYVKDGQELVNFEGVEALKLDFRLPEIHLPKLATGQPVEVTTDTLPGRSFAATVDAVDPLIEAGNRSVAVRARLPNPGGVLRPGMFVRVQLRFGSRDGVLMIPEQALVPAAQGQAVFVVTEGKAKQAPVRLGARRAGSVEIVSGLKAGDTVVTAGQLKLRDGAPVRAAGEAPTAGMAGMSGMGGAPGPATKPAQ